MQRVPVSHAVVYDAFGAVGDGVTDDLPAIAAAHAHANRHGLPVRSRPGAVHLLGDSGPVAAITTPTTWTGTRFVIDDTALTVHSRPVFDIRSQRPKVRLGLKELAAGQERLPQPPGAEVLVTVTDETVRQYIRRGPNRNSGTAKTDVFVVDAEGYVRSPIDWDYPAVSTVEAMPIDTEPLEVTGGHFTTIANRAPSTYDYHHRGIRVSRSRVTLAGLEHRIEGEGEHGAPYAGFVDVRGCAYVTVADCHLAGHRIYTTIGNAGTPVGMGSYDLSATSAVGLTISGCRQDDILDRSRWGVMGSNFCKDLVVDDCVLSRTDAHQGVTGCTVRNSTMGWMGINAIGRGRLTLENVTTHGPSVISFRDDYGSTWTGPLTIRGCTWVVPQQAPTPPAVLRVRNDGMHDFGYPCTMPSPITVDGLTIDDSAAPDGEIVLISDPDAGSDAGPDTSRPHALRRPDAVDVRGLHTTSGRELSI